jgi:hypothetical protein
MKGGVMHNSRFIALAAGTLLAGAVQAQSHTYGRLEHALVVGSKPITVEAQLDGGGDITVLYVNNIKYASAEGGMAVTFTIDNGEVMSGRTVDLALPVLKDQLVHERDGTTMHQPLVAMSFCIGTVSFSNNVILKPRLNFVPPLLLGKADAAVFAPIDPLKKNTGDPACAPPPAPATAPAAAQ